MCHAHTTDVCLEYFEKMRRQVYQTPKSYLSFIAAYQVIELRGNQPVSHFSATTRPPWLGPNGPKIGKETTHFMVRWTRVASMA